MLGWCHEHVHASPKVHIDTVEDGFLGNDNSNVMSPQSPIMLAVHYAVQALQLVMWVDVYAC